MFHVPIVTSEFSKPYANLAVEAHKGYSHLIVALEACSNEAWMDP